MGADYSKLPNQSIIDDKTQSTIVIMNRILNFILTQSDIKDMISLANPDTCAKWIVIAETKIADLFDKIQIQPELGKDGIIYMKKIDSLQKETKKDGLNQYYCKILAFFFIRMFQVVGALALSIIDTKLPDTNYSETSTKVEISERKGVPFFKKLEDKSKRFGLFGGQLSEPSSITPFDAFAVYFTKNSDNTYSLNSFSLRSSEIRKIPGLDKIIFNSSKMIVNYKSGSVNVQFNLRLDGSQLHLEDVKRYFDGKEFITPYKNTYNFARQSSGKITVTDKSVDFADFILHISEHLIKLPKSNTINILNKFGYLINSSISNVQKIKGAEFREENAGIFLNDDEKSEANPKFYFGFSKTVAGKVYTVEVSFNLTISENTKNTYTVEISHLENKSKSIDFTPYLEDDDDDENDDTKESTRKFKAEYDTKAPVYGRTKQTIPQYLVAKFSKVISQAVESMHHSDFKRKEGYLAPVKERAGTENFLRTTELWRTLLQEPPIKSFCVARALQLLNKSGLMSQIPEKIQPLVFNTKFALIGNHSLPVPGQSITTAAPFKALETLYHNPSGIKGIEKADPKKIQSLEKLILSFESFSKGSSLADILEPSGSIIAPFESELHKKKVDELRNQAVTLFNTHFDHVKKVNSLLKKMFILEKGPITLHPNILNKGVLGIENIAHEARDLLTDYYSNCQIEYSKGVKILVSKDVGIVAPKRNVINSNSSRRF